MSRDISMFYFQITSLFLNLFFAIFLFCAIHCEEHSSINMQLGVVVGIKNPLSFPREARALVRSRENPAFCHQVHRKIVWQENKRARKLFSQWIRSSNRITDVKAMATGIHWLDIRPRRWIDEGVCHSSYTHERRWHKTDLPADHVLFFVGTNYFHPMYCSL